MKLFACVSETEAQEYLRTGRFVIIPYDDKYGAISFFKVNPMQTCGQACMIFEFVVPNDLQLTSKSCFREAAYSWQIELSKCERTDSMYMYKLEEDFNLEVIRIGSECQSDWKYIRKLLKSAGRKDVVIEVLRRFTDNKRVYVDEEYREDAQGLYLLKYDSGCSMFGRNFVRVKDVD